ncbi:MAG TPA: CHASE domain-containing protein, partial [Burkholderiaceae bacterium]|nr:CHASE domain-containing protein [Burkholderiaceae bacterium]
MKLDFRPLRLFVELLGIVAISAAVVTMVMPVVVLDMSAVAQALLDAAMVILVAGPAIFWRCLAATRRIARQQRAAERGQRPAPPRQGTLRSAILITAIAQIVGLVMTLSAVVWIKQQIDAQTARRFERQVENIEANVMLRFQRPIYGVKGLRGIYAANARVSSASFRAYVESGQIEQEFPGVRGFGFIQPVKRADLNRFIAAERADQGGTFSVISLGEHDDLFVIKLIEPLSLNVAAWGYDIASEPARREAAERAIATGELTLTAPVPLRQADARNLGVLYMLPIYRAGADPTTIEQRRDALVGIAYAPVVITELMEGFSQLHDPGLRLELFDRRAGNNFVLFSSQPAESPKHAAHNLHAEQRTATRLLKLGGRELVLHVESTPAFEASTDRSSLLSAAVGGMFMSFVLALAAWLLASGRVRAQSLAHRMTADLDRLAKVVQRTSNAVLITDADFRVQWVNDGFTRLSGYTLDDVKGRQPSEVLHSPLTSPDDIRRIGEAVAAGTSYRGEIVNRSRDGRDYWLEVDLQPLRNDQGELTGFMTIETDITALKNAETRAEAALRETKALFETIHMHAIVSVTDRGGRITDANEAFCKISGYTREELIGQNHRIVNSGVQPRAFWEEMWAMISAGKPWRGEICNRAKDGALYWVDSIIAPFVSIDGRIVKYVSIRTDITTRKTASRELAAEREQLANILRGTNAGTWDWNVQTGEVRFNERWADIVGYTLAELAPLSIRTWTSLAHPDDLRRSGDLLQRH